MKVVNNGLTIEIGGAFGHFPKEFVVSALEKQIPKKVEPREDKIEMFGIKGGICPSCGFNKIYNSLSDYCHKCGQALDWSDTNDR